MSKSEVSPIGDMSGNQRQVLMIGAWLQAADTIVHKAGLIAMVEMDLGRSNLVAERIAESCSDIISHTYNIIRDLHILQVEL